MIAEAVRQAQIMHRKVIEETYDGVCTIYEQQPFEDPETLDTVFEEVQVQGDIPCHLSYSSAPAVTDNGTGAALTQTILLFMAPEMRIRPGSRIEVTQQGVTKIILVAGSRRYISLTRRWNSRYLRSMHNGRMGKL